MRWVLGQSVPSIAVLTLKMHRQSVERLSPCSPFMSPAYFYIVPGCDLFTELRYLGTLWITSCGWSEKPENKVAHIIRSRDSFEFV